ncbi:N-acetylmuramoyl-L-alanine amidase [Streptomyces uncialis]|uniref:peptidoglycan recognition protein family protein n=1 Tax=Streptomyces uncialis TaxID=1048205 RepID=UPI003864E2B1|nr:N-acetylmuramoyl-L-alanine amidase [Streptomyces uncialis]
MTGQRRRPAEPTRRGVFVIGGGLLLAPAVAILLGQDRTAQSVAPRTQARAQPPGMEPASTPPRPPGWMPGVLRKPIDKNFRRGGRSGQQGLIMHVQEGEGSLFERFSDPSTRSSAHFWVSQAGVIEQYISVHDRAWTQGAGNVGWASLETSGFASKPLTTAQVASVARVYAWGAREHGWPLEVADSPDGRGLGTHEMGGASWGGHACPGPIRAGQRGAVMRRVRRLSRA